MPLITDCQDAKEIYKNAADLGIALPAFCAEDRETLEAILASALEIGKEIGVENIPIIPAWTSRYPARPQMALLTACGNPRLGTQLMLSDLNTFMGKTSPYHKLLVMPHLDHAFPWLDGDILYDFVDQFASAMFDASKKPFEENIQLTSEYVQKVHGRIIVEGAVDEILESNTDSQKSSMTTVEQASKFLKETGVDIIVPNVGTEHRSTIDKVQYNCKHARKISSAVGKILCIHGASSIKHEELNKLPEDGFVKVNIYTTLAVTGGQAVAENILKNLGNIFSKEQLQNLIHQGILSEKTILSYNENKYPIKPKLNYVANPIRRDAWFEAVKNKCKEFLRLFNYSNYAK
jgi:fructose-bisphosphate aldolase class II